MNIKERWTRLGRLRWARKIERLHGRNPSRCSGKTLCLLIGPESSGTRLFTSILSDHPSIMGTPEAHGHLDVLDEVWRAVQQRNVKQAVRIFPDMNSSKCILTRRSMPHSPVFGEPAMYMDFANLPKLEKVARRLQMELLLLITTRSPVPNLLSWKNNRLSADKSLEKAYRQYEACYRFLFDFLNKSRTSYYMLSLEALLLDKNAYIQSLFELLGLPHHELRFCLNEDTNQKHYADSQAIGEFVRNMAQQVDGEI